MGLTVWPILCEMPGSTYFCWESGKVGKRENAVWNVATQVCRPNKEGTQSQKEISQEGSDCQKESSLHLAINSKVFHFFPLAKAAYS